jgi:hypothetical protein
VARVRFGAVDFRRYRELQTVNAGPDAAFGKSDWGEGGSYEAEESERMLGMIAAVLRQCKVNARGQRTPEQKGRPASGSARWRSY